MQPFAMSAQVTSVGATQLPVGPAGVVVVVVVVGVVVGGVVVVGVDDQWNQSLRLL
jgi:hypothetical protein